MARLIRNLVIFAGVLTAFALSAAPAHARATQCRIHRSGVPKLIHFNKLRSPAAHAVLKSRSAAHKHRSHHAPLPVKFAIIDGNNLSFGKSLSVHPLILAEPPFPVTASALSADISSWTSRQNLRLHQLKSCYLI